MVARLLAPLIIGLVMLALGHAKAGWLVGILLGSGAALMAFLFADMARKRALRQAPRAADLRPGEQALLHGPVKVTAVGEARDCWAYLSDQRLSLLPMDGGAGVEVDLTRLEEVRPTVMGWMGSGTVTVVTAGLAYELKLAQPERWEAALRGKSRKA